MRNINNLIPGFRTNKLWKKIIAVFGYLLIFLFIAISIGFDQNFNSTVKDKILTLINHITFIVFVFVVPLALLTNFANIRRFFTAANKNTFIRGILSTVISIFIVIISFVLFATISMATGNSFSKEYKEKEEIYDQKELIKQQQEEKQIAEKLKIEREKKAKEQKKLKTVEANSKENVEKKKSNEEKVNETKELEEKKVKEETKAKAKNNDAEERQEKDKIKNKNKEAEEKKVKEEAKEKKKEAKEKKVKKKAEEKKKKEDEKKEKEQLEKQKDKKNLDLGVNALENGEYVMAQNYLKKIKKKSVYYKKAQTVLSENSSNILEQQKVEYVESCLEIDYRNIKKNANDYVDQCVHFYGYIDYIQEINNKTLIVMSTGNEFDSDNYAGYQVVFLFPITTSVIEGDYVDIYGEVKGNFGNNSKYISSYLEDSYEIYYYENTTYKLMPIISGQVIIDENGIIY